jgi:endonuclease/exonuclease/phosphatase family metal-dependent hydrolase
MAFSMHSAMQSPRTVTLASGVQIKATNTRFIQWRAMLANASLTHGDTTQEAQEDQLLVMWHATLHTKTPIVTGIDGAGFAWHATVTMASATEGSYSNPGRETRQINIMHVTQFVTYNCLTGPPPGQSLSVYEEELTHATTTQRRWATRMHNVKRELVGKDIAVLNEITPGMLNDLNLPDTQTAWYKKKGPYNYDGTAIVINTKRFTFRKTYHFQLSTNSSQIGVAAAIRDTLAGEDVVVLGLHLKSGYGNYEPLRKKQFAAAMQFISSNSETLPNKLIVAGDLNSDLQNTYSANGVAADAAELGLVNVMNTAPKTTTYNYHHASTFDYVFVRNIRGIVSARVPPAGNTTPNDQQGSDHLPVHATLVL